jgi:ubiquinol-cytochrome c reductase iron-sulfur subunit
MDEEAGHATKPQRRRIMFAAGACAVGGGALFLSQQHNATRSWPHGTPLKVDIAGLPEGKLKTVEWQGKPVWILRRRPGEIAALQKGGEALADADSRESLQPPYTRNALRSLRPEIFVAIGLCTHQGCTPALNGDHFLCPCHTSRYDLAGRVFKVGPAQVNLVIPAYRFDGDNTLIVGEDT